MAKKDQTKNVLIYSYYGEYPEGRDGVYYVAVPQKYAEDYKKIICEVGEVLETYKGGGIDSVDDIEIEPSAVLTKQDYENLWVKIEDEWSEGCSLGSILNVLGWDYETEITTFDADYNRFY